MPYTLTVHALFLSEVLFGDSVTASIFVPPASPGLIGVGATPLDTATVTTGTTFTLAFSSTAIPPTAAFDMLLSDNKIPGDLFRSGQLFGLPPSPGTLNLSVYTQAEEPGRISNLLQQQFPHTFPIDDLTKIIVGVYSGGVVVPQSIAVNDATLTFGHPNPIEVKATGSLDIKYLGITDQSSGFSLTCNLTVGPSGDPLNTSRIVKVTASVSSADLIIDTLLLLPPAVLVITQFMETAIAFLLEKKLNEMFARLVSDALARFSPPLQLTDTSVISLGRFADDEKGLNVTLVVGDLFGPGIEAIPIPKYIAMEVTPQWKCGVAENYTITVRDSADGSPIPGARVSLISGDWAHRPNPKREGTTDANGRTEFRDVVLKDRVVRMPQKGGPPENVEYQPLVQVSAKGFTTFTAGIDCPSLTGDG